MIKDYRIYIFSRKEMVLCFVEGMIFNLVISMLFFNSLWAMIPGMILVFFYFLEKRKKLMRRRKNRLQREFKEFLNALIAALQTGRSMENAFLQALKDTEGYFEKDTELVTEIKRICAGVSMGESLEKLLLDFAGRSHLEEVEYFAEVLSVGKRSGGNLIGIMKNTIRMLQERMEAQEELLTILAEKQMEFSLMCVIPLAIIIYLRVAAAGLLETLYGNLTGIVVMTVCLAVYGGCFLYGKRLLEIEN